MDKHVVEQAADCGPRIHVRVIKSAGNGDLQRQFVTRLVLKKCRQERDQSLPADLEKPFAVIFLPGEYIKVSEVRLHETLILALFHVEFCIDGTVAPLEVEPGVRAQNIVQIHQIDVVQPGLQVEGECVGGGREFQPHPKPSITCSSAFNENMGSPAGGNVG